MTTQAVEAEQQVPAEAPEATAATEEAQPLLNEAPDQPAPDTAPETSGSDAPVETAPVRHTLADFSDDEIEGDDRIRSLLARREESARRKAQREQQRQAGSNQQVQYAVATLLNQVNSGDLTPEQFANAAQQVIHANRVSAAHEIAEELPGALMRQWTLPVEVREKALEARDDGNIDTYVSTLIGGAVDVELSKRRLRDVPEDSSLHRDIQAEVNRRVEAEMKAKAVQEQPKRETPPATPRGQAGGAGIKSAEDAITKYIAGEISKEEYGKARIEFGIAKEK